MIQAIKKVVSRGLMKKGYVKEIIALVIILNLIQLSYFLFHRAPGHGASNAAEQRTHSYVAKTWSHVPSYTPWLADAEHNPAHSCEAFFGNGFTRLYENLKKSGNGGSFRCQYSETLRTSICDGTKVIMHPQRIQMTRGGEEIDSVIGRNEDGELPTFMDGAFEIQVPKGKPEGALLEGISLDMMPRGQVHRHTLRSLLESIRTVSSKQAVCSEVITRPTLFVTRFEYANLFHTVTDWYSSYASSRVVGLDERPMVVLLDGHCKSPMDDGWEAFFSGVKYAKHFGADVCFDHAIFVPLGYDTALFKCLSSGLPCTGSSPADLDSSKTARLREFGEMFSASFTSASLDTSEEQVDKSAGPGDIQILFIRREDYLAHPRHTGRPEARLRNEAELYTTLVDWAESRSPLQRRVTIIDGLFAHMKLAEQVKAVQAASVILGVHGAGLTHIVFAKPGTVVLEILSPLFMRPHYQFISQWMGIEYHSIVMEELTVDCNQVVQHLSQFVQSIEVKTAQT